MCIIDCLSTIVFILPLHLDYTKVIILILWWRNFQLEYWRTFQLVSTKQYTNELHRVNHLLKKIGKLLDLPIPLTMYVGRHSWASIAKSRNVPVSVISEGMGMILRTLRRFILHRWIPPC